MPATGLLATASVLAAATSEWWLIALGLLAGGTLMFTGTSSDGHELPGLDAVHRARAHALLASCDAVKEQLTHTSSLSRPALEPMIDQAIRLIARHQQLQQYVQMTPDSVVRAERDRLKRLAVNEADADAKARYLEAMNAREGQLADAASLRSQAGRLDAEISSVHAKVDAIHTQLLKLRSLRLPDERVNEALGSLSQELGALNDAYASLKEHTS